MTNVTPERILLATDGSEDAGLAGRAAVDLSNRTGAGLHVIHARQDVRFATDPPAPAANEYLRTLRDRGELPFLEEVQKILPAQVQETVRWPGADPRQRIEGHTLRVSQRAE